MPLAARNDFNARAKTNGEDEEQVFHRRVGYLGNGIFLITPNGRTLDGEPGPALQAYARLPLKERTKLEDFGKAVPKRPAPPEGGIILKMYRRTLARDKQGRLYTPKTLIHYEAGAESLVPLGAEAQRDYLWLTQTEWRSLMPADAKVGASFAVAPAIVDRIGRYYLIDATSGITQKWFWKPGDVLGQHLTGTVGERSDKKVRILLAGEARYAADQKGAAVSYKLQGVLEYAPGGRTLDRFDMTAFADNAHWRAKQPYEPIGVAFELAAADDALASKTEPFFLGDPRYFAASK